MTPTPRLVPDRPPLVARLRCLAVLLQQLNAQTACAAVNEAVELIEAAAPPAEAPAERGARVCGAMFPRHSGGEPKDLDGCLLQDGHRGPHEFKA